jgi:hypothetical protein
MNNTATASPHDSQPLNGFGLSGVVPFASPMQTITFTDAVKKFGITIMMAFISRCIIRRDLFQPFDDLIAISRFYSHVFAWLRMLKDKKILALDVSITERNDSVVHTRFKKAMKANRQPHFYPWSSGLLDLTDALQASGDLEKFFLKDVVEWWDRHQSFKLWQELGMNAMRQSFLFIDTQDDVERPDPNYMARLRYHINLDHWPDNAEKENFLRLESLYSEFALKVQNTKRFSPQELSHFKSALSEKVTLFLGQQATETQEKASTKTNIFMMDHPLILLRKNSRILTSLWRGFARLFPSVAPQLKNYLINHLFKSPVQES